MKTLEWVGSSKKDLKALPEDEGMNDALNTVTSSCGNVYEDLGLPDAESMLVKAQLAATIKALSGRLRKRPVSQETAHDGSQRDIACYPHKFLYESGELRAAKCPVVLLL